MNSQDSSVLTEEIANSIKNILDTYLSTELTWVTAKMASFDTQQGITVPLATDFNVCLGDKMPIAHYPCLRIIPDSEEPFNLKLSGCNSFIEEIYSFQIQIFYKGEKTDIIQRQILRFSSAVKRCLKKYSTLNNTVQSSLVKSIGYTNLVKEGGGLFKGCFIDFIASGYTS